MLGTHNSMTYLPPKHWWLYPFRFIAKCQKVNIKDQYHKYGIRLFDFRVGYDKDGNMEFKHGSMSYKGNVYDTLEYLNSQPEPVYIRFILETNKKDAGEGILFSVDCQLAEEKYTNIKFFGGNRKCDWYRIYEFRNSDLPLTQMISSMTWKKWDDWYPWLYAKVMNKKNRELYKDAEYLLLDFIEL